MKLKTWLVVATVLLATMMAAPPFSHRSAQAAELIMFESQSCPWCRRWHEQIGPIYPRTPEGRIAPLRRVPLERPIPRDLQFIDRGRFTPTFVLIDDGREIGRITGYPGEDFFWSLLGELLARLER